MDHHHSHSLALGKQKSEGTGLPFTLKCRTCTDNFCSNPFGQNVVTWPHPAERDAEKYKLYSEHHFTQIKVLGELGNYSRKQSHSGRTNIGGLPAVAVTHYEC